MFGRESNIMMNSELITDNDKYYKIILTDKYYLKIYILNTDT